MVSIFGVITPSYLLFLCKHSHAVIFIIPISIHLKLWMNVTLDSNCMVFAQLGGIGSKPKFQNENICLKRDSNKQLLTQTADALDSQECPADYCQKLLDRSLFDKSMKFGTVVVYSITKDISYDPKQNRSKIWYFGVKQ